MTLHQMLCWLETNVRVRLLRGTVIDTHVATPLKELYLESRKQQ